MNGTHATSKSPHVLIVDDDAAIVDALSLMLEMEGFRVSSYDGTRLRDEVLTIKPSLILLDVWLSGQDGRELCHMLKSDPKTKHIPVVLISASRHLEESAKKVLANGYLEKPFEMERVVDTINRLLT